jgi:hypothetical protein
MRQKVWHPGVELPTLTTAPAYKFGSRAASDYNLEKVSQPSPGEYGAGPQSVGPQFLSNNENSTVRLYKLKSVESTHSLKAPGFNH